METCLQKFGQVAIDIREKILLITYLRDDMAQCVEYRATLPSFLGVVNLMGNVYTVVNLYIALRLLLLLLLQFEKKTWIANHVELLIQDSFSSLL